MGTDPRRVVWVALVAALTMVPALADVRSSPDGRWVVRVVDDPDPPHVDSDPKRIEIHRMSDGAAMAGFSFASDATDPRPADARTQALWNADSTLVAISTHDANATVFQAFALSGNGFEAFAPGDHLTRLDSTSARRAASCWRAHARPEGWLDAAQLQFTFVGACEFADGSRGEACHRFVYDFSSLPAPRHVRSEPLH